ncbi:ZIP family metal transporter [Epidermidibacterium keratini]|uniref:ZIP family metal transporter n=2 Tax=Epidermidibacterium keratini TaxID=1891644 RepID=A0A7L4YUA9_9ACTN|nr:ZIP family metal transporter [Epidermidibacterium keratini]
MIVTDLAHAALLTAFPVGAAAVGAVVAAIRKPSPRVMSAVQHFAAGVVIAAVVGEILPDLREEARWSWAVFGFAIGVVVVLALAAWGRRIDRNAVEAPGAEPPRIGAPSVGASSSASEAPDRAEVARAVGKSALPIGLIATVAIDLLIDGALVGLGTTLGSTQAIILTAALTIEVLFLALSVQGELTAAGMTPWRAAGTSAGLGLMAAVGAMGSALALSHAGPGPIAGTLAFGAAALLYLAVEELLVEAHEESETIMLTAMFFLGFFIIYGLTQLGG